MTEDIDNIPESWLAALGGSDAAGWLTAFHKAPEKAVAALLWDTFYFGSLNVTERGQLLTGWLELLGNKDSFAERLDAELTRWVERNWGNFDRRAEILISAWSCLCSVVELSSRLYADSRLTRCAAALRAHFAERQSFLGSFSISPAADPLGLYLAVLAEFQGEDRSLAAFWHQMCFLPDSVPFYHARYAMLGLRRLKAVNPVEDGTLRAEIVLGLLHLARSFDRLARERGLEVNLARDTFFRVAAQTAAAYPNSRLWLEHGKAEFDKLPDRAKEWILQAVRPFKEAEEHSERKSASRQRQQSSKFFAWNPSWPSRREELLQKLRKGKIDCIPQVMSLLSEERLYAESTSDSTYFVRTLCRFASRAVHFSPKVALVWAIEARERAPYDPFTWSTLRTILLNQGQLAEALRFAWVAWKRFPQNDVIRNDLADTLKAARRHEEAVGIYLQTIEHFPNDPVARNGLADVLRVMRRYNDAFAVYRETIKLFSDNIVECIIARTGLAGTLRSAGRWREAEAEYRSSIESGHANSSTLVGLATVVLRKGEAGRVEALSLVNKALELDAHHQQARELKRQLNPESEMNLSELATQWDRVAEALLESSAFTLAEDIEPLPKVAEEVDSETTEPETAAEPQAEDSAPPILQTTTTEAETAPSKDKEIKPQPISEPLDDSATEERLPVSQDEAPPSIETKKPTSIPQQAKKDKPEDSVARIRKAEPQKNFKAPTPPSTTGKSSGKTGEQLPETRQAPPPVQREGELKSEPGVVAKHVVAEAEAEEPKSHIRLAAYDPIMVAALVAEAYFYRTWTRDAGPGVRALRRRKAADLIDRAERLAPQDAQVLAEKIALSVDKGDESVAYENLTTQIGSHPASAPLLVLKAQLDRNKAHRESRPLNKLNLDELCIFPQRLRALNPTLTPLFHFQKGLAAMALLDGQVRVETAAGAFTKFRRMLARRADEERKDGEASHTRAALNFHEWLQMQVNNRIFPRTTEAETIDVSAGDIHFLEATWEQSRSALEEVESVFADLLAFGTI